MSRAHVWKWCRNFNSGRESMHDEERCGCKLVITERIVDSMEGKTVTDRCVAISELCKVISASFKEA